MSAMSTTVDAENASRSGTGGVTPVTGVAIGRTWLPDTRVARDECTCPHERERDHANE
jgi:hypothetical protein